MDPNILRSLSKFRGLPNGTLILGNPMCVTSQNKLQAHPSRGVQLSQAAVTGLRRIVLRSQEPVLSFHL